MRPFDAIFLALAASLFLQRPRHWWLVALAPLVAWVAGNVQIYDLSLQQFEAPVVALAVCLLAPRYAPVALLLALPEYQGLFDAARAAALWIAATAILDSLKDRFDAEALPPRMRGRPIELLSIGILYYTLLPVAYL